MTKKTRAGTNRPARPAKKLIIDRQVLRDLPPAADDAAIARGGVSGGVVGSFTTGQSRDQVKSTFSRSSIA